MKLPSVMDQHDLIISFMGLVYQINLTQLDTDEEQERRKQKFLVDQLLTVFSYFSPENKTKARDFWNKYTFQSYSFEFSTKFHWEKEKDAPNEIH